MMIKNTVYMQRLFLLAVAVSGFQVQAAATPVDYRAAFLEARACVLSAAGTANTPNLNQLVSHSETAAVGLNIMSLVSKFKTIVPYVPEDVFFDVLYLFDQEVAENDCIIVAGSYVIECVLVSKVWDRFVSFMTAADLLEPEAIMRNYKIRNTLLTLLQLKNDEYWLVIAPHMVWNNEPLYSIAIPGLDGFKGFGFEYYPDGSAKLIVPGDDDEPAEIIEVVQDRVYFSLEAAKAIIDEVELD